VLGERLLRIGLWLTVAAVAFQTVAHLSNEFLLDDRMQALDADVEVNVFTWASSVATFAVAVAAFLHAFARIALEEGLELGGWLLAAVGLTTAVVVALMQYRPEPAPA
jgi:hypothetical protein